MTETRTTPRHLTKWEQSSKTPKSTFTPPSQTNLSPRTGRKSRNTPGIDIKVIPTKRDTVPGAVSDYATGRSVRAPEARCPDPHDPHCTPDRPLFTFPLTMTWTLGHRVYADSCEILDLEGKLSRPLQIDRRRLCWNEEIVRFFRFEFMDWFDFETWIKVMNVVVKDISEHIVTKFEFLEMFPFNRRRCTKKSPFHAYKHFTLLFLHACFL